MEAQSPTPLQSNKIEKRNDAMNKFSESIKSNLYYIYVVLMILANCLLSILRVNGEGITFEVPHDLMGWIMWIVQIGMSTFIGVMILWAFRKQGITNGKKYIKDIENEYLKAIASPIAYDNPRSPKQYLASTSKKDILGKVFILIIVNAYAGGAAISANFNGLLALVCNIIMAVGFGIMSMLDAENYTVTELPRWYRKEIEKIKEKEKEDGRHKERNKSSTIRQAKSNRVQPKKKRGTGQGDSKSKSTNTTVTEPVTSGLPTQSILRSQERKSDL